MPTHTQTGTPAPQWVQAALSWGREMSAFCDQAEAVQEFVDGEQNVSSDEAHNNLVNATRIGMRAVGAWRTAGAAPLDVSNAIAQLNEIVVRDLAPLAERTDYTDPAAFERTAQEWIPGAVEVCNRISDVEDLVRAQLETMLGGIGESFKAGVVKAVVMDKLKKAGLFFLAVGVVVSVIILAKRSD